MSNTAAATLDAEPELPGVEPAPEPSTAALLYVAIIGHAVRNARVYTPDHHTVVLELMLRQHDAAHPRVLPLLVQQRWDTRYTDVAAVLAAAQRTAASLPAGTRAVVRGFGLEHIVTRSQAGECLRLMQVDLMQPYTSLNNPERNHAHHLAA